VDALCAYTLEEKIAMSMRARILAIVSFLTVLLMPAPSYALEVDYPSFLPLSESLSLSQMIDVLFTGAIILGAIVAFITLVYVGIQYIVSGANPAARSRARDRFIAVIIGILILLTSVLLLRTINPDLVDIKNIQISIPTIGPIDVPDAPPENFVAGSDYAEFPLSKTLDDSRRVVQELTNDLPPLLASVKSLASQCSANLCTPGTTNYSRYDGDENYNCRDVPDPLDPLKTIEVCDTRPICTPALCTGTSCTGDPLPSSQQARVSNAISKTTGDLDALTDTLTLITDGQSAVQQCTASSTNRSVLSCPIAKLLDPEGRYTSGCRAFEDFFCGFTDGGVLSKITVPISDLVAAQEALLATLDEITTGIENASCANTSFSCPSGGFCSAGTAQCADTVTDSGSQGCPPELFEKLAEVKVLRGKLAQNVNALNALLQDSAAVSELVEVTGGEAALVLCAEASAHIQNILSEPDIYVNGACLEGTGCCPSESTITSVQNCSNIDLYLCS
jgi:hypothetical protein